jgi:hypothetical protein
MTIKGPMEASVEKFMIHSITGQIVEVDMVVLRRVLTVARHNLRDLPDKTAVEYKAEELIRQLQFTYPELV